MSFSRNIEFHDVFPQGWRATVRPYLQQGAEGNPGGEACRSRYTQDRSRYATVSDQDEAAIKEIVKRDFGPKIFPFARCMKDDVKRSIDCRVKNIVMEVSTSDHLLKYAYKWTPEKAIELSIESTLYARDNGMYVCFFTIDGTRTGIDEYLDLIEKIVKEGHKDELTVVDTMGGLHTHAVPFLIKKVKERIPNKPIGIHFHDDFGRGIASVNVYLDMIGVQIDDNDKKLEMVGMIKKKAFEKSGLLTLDEFKDIAHKVLDR